MEYQDVKQHIVTKSWNIGMQNITEYQNQETSANKKNPCTPKYEIVFVNIRIQCLIL
jgi:hypothetical protein